MYYKNISLHLAYLQTNEKYLEENKMYLENIGLHLGCNAEKVIYNS